MIPNCSEIHFPSPYISSFARLIYPDSRLRRTVNSSLTFLPTGFSWGLSACTQHRITKKMRLEGILRHPPSPTPDQNRVNQSRLLWATSTWVLSIPKEETPEPFWVACVAVSDHVPLEEFFFSVNGIFCISVCAHFLCLLHFIPSNIYTW